MFQAQPSIVPCLNGTGALIPEFWTLSLALTCELKRPVRSHDLEPMSLSYKDRPANALTIGC